MSANRIFIESLKFSSNVGKDLQLIDLNQTVRPALLQAAENSHASGRSAISTTGASTAGSELGSAGSAEGLFDETVCFHTDDIRQYLFLLKPIKQSFRIDNSV